MTLYNHEDKVVAATHDISLKDIVYKFYQCNRGALLLLSFSVSKAATDYILTKALLSCKASL